jgi:hypothetical protein
LALTRVWWGPAHEPDSPLPAPVILNRRILNPPVPEPRLLQVTIVALVLLLVVAGLWPNAALQMLNGGRP